MKSREELIEDIVTASNTEKDLREKNNGKLPVIDDIDKDPLIIQHKAYKQLIGKEVKRDSSWDKPDDSLRQEVIKAAEYESKFLNALKEKERLMKTTYEIIAGKQPRDFTEQDMEKLQGLRHEIKALEGRFDSLHSELKEFQKNGKNPISIPIDDYLKELDSSSLFKRRKTVDNTMTEYRHTHHETPSPEEQAQRRLGRLHS